ncbi:MAG: FixH family protein [Anderseniella sp.]
MNSQSSQEKQFTGKHMLLLMLAFFGVIITVNLTMATFATSSWTGLVVKNSYVASQDFNRELAEARKQTARGWTGDISYADGAIVLSLIDNKGDGVSLDSVVADVGRPAFEQVDHKVILTSHGNGIYRAEDRLLPGVWQVSIRAKSLAGDYRLDKRLIIKGAGQ